MSAPHLSAQFELVLFGGWPPHGGYADGADRAGEDEAPQIGVYRRVQHVAQPIDVGAEQRCGVAGVDQLAGDMRAQEPALAPITNFFAPAMGWNVAVKGRDQ